VTIEARAEDRSDDKHDRSDDKHDRSRDEHERKHHDEREELKPGAHKIEFVVQSLEDEKVIRHEKSSFIVPR
jgi:hypothetical protein